MSFAGKYDPLGGKYYVRPEEREWFLGSVYAAIMQSGRVFLAEYYNGRPYR
jgi:hypothetical protein